MSETEHALHGHRAFQGKGGADDASLFAAWTNPWKDLVEFEIVPVRTSAEAVQVIAPRL